MSDIGQYFKEDIIDHFYEQKWWDSQKLSYEDWVNSCNNLNKKI